MPWTPTEQYDSDDANVNDCTRTQPAYSPVSAATPPKSEGEADEHERDICEMDEEDHWFATSREQTMYPKDMQDVRGEEQDILLKKEAMRHEFKASKNVRRNLKKKQRKAAAKK